MITALQEIEIQKTGLLSPLITDYLAQKGTIAHLYKYPPSLSSFANVIRDKVKDNTDRKLLVEVLKAQYDSIPTTELVNSNIESLLSDKTFTVVASHQPCLFMGPLFNIYKIAAAINLTKQLKQTYPDYHFVPVFWLGSEDHDVEELNHTWINGKKIEWKEPGTGVSGQWKTATMGPVVEELKLLLPDSGFSKVIEDGLKKYDTFGRFTQYLVNEVFKEHGLVVLDQDDVKLKKKFGHIINEEVMNTPAAVLLQANVEFLEKHYKAQAKPRDLNFFYTGDGFRERIIFNSLTQKFSINNKHLSFNLEEMIDEIELHPERFSPNVIYRPVYQEMILPNLAFIGGAGELSYWLEMEPLFNHYQVNYPVLLLRPSAAIVPASVGKKLDKLGLKLEDFFGDIEQLINRYVKDNLNGSISLDAEKQQVQQVFDTLSAKAEAADVTLKQSVASEKQKALASLETIETKIFKAEKRKQETAVNQLRAIHAVLFPQGEPQERMENFLPFYGEGFIEGMVKYMDPLKEGFEVFLDE